MEFVHIYFIVILIIVKRHPSHYPGGRNRKYLFSGLIHDRGV